jgi:hypothetical protein
MKVGVLAAALVLAGCGGDGDDGRVARSAAETVAAAENCVRVDQAAGQAYLVCRERGRPDHGRFVVEEGGERRSLPLAAPTASPAGHWAWMAVSPNGETLLAQWIAECEVPVAYLVPAVGGTPRPVVAKDVESIALGWTAAGDAEVALPKGVCARGSIRPGVYTVPAAGGKPTYVRPIDPARDTVRG